MSPHLPPPDWAYRAAKEIVASATGDDDYAASIIATHWARETRETEQDLATMVALIEDHLSFHSYVEVYPLLANALAAYRRKHPRT